MSLSRSQVNYGKGLGEIYSDFELFEEPIELCDNCGEELEWNGECSECGGDEQ